MTLSPVGGPGSQPPIKKPTPQQEAEGMKKLGEIAADTAAGAVAGSIIPGLGTVLGAAAGFAFGVVHTVVEGAIESMSGEGGETAPPGADFDAPGEAKPFDQARYDGIAQIYRDVLGREPDPGIEGWMNSGKPLDQIRSEIANSPEARTNAITKMYQEILGREPDAEGLKQWVEGGVPLDQVEAGIKNSPEAQAKSAAAGAAALLAQQQAQTAATDATKSTDAPAAPQRDPAQIKEFKDFLIKDSSFRFGVNTATDGKYDDPQIQYATKEFLDAGLDKGLNLDDIKKSVTAFDKAFDTWKQDTSKPRPTPDQFLQKTYHQTAF